MTCVDLRWPAMTCVDLRWLKMTCVDLRWLAMTYDDLGWLTMTCVDLRWLTMTCDDSRWLWSSSNSYASRRKFFPVWPPSASRHKLIVSHLYMRESFDFLRRRCVNLRADLRIRLATHRKSVRKFWFCKLALAIVTESVWPGLKFVTQTGACLTGTSESVRPPLISLAVLVFVCVILFVVVVIYIERWWKPLNKQKQTGSEFLYFYLFIYLFIYSFIYLYQFLRLQGTGQS